MNSRFLILVQLILIISCKPSENIGKGPVEPGEALATFELEPGYKIECIASEPLISDPVDMEIDEYGRLYVVELHGYPLDLGGSGVIKLLADTDGDGRMDQGTVFADKLVMPFGIMRWKKGVLVADAPNILYMEDTDGDGKADVRDTLLTGFAVSNAQMNVSNPVYGLDNWIYVTSESGSTYQIYKKEFGDLGSDILYPDQPDGPRLPLKGSGRTVRFRPDWRALELTSGKTQFGHDFDSRGHHILGNNSNHIYHEVIADSYLKRNPDLLVSNATQNMTDHGEEVFPITQNPEHQLLTNIGIFTSACGNIAYSGAAFTEAFNKNVFFVCEPVSNMVHADLLVDTGTSFKARRIGRPNKEFLASTDFWFRPVNLYSGPDGALYVVDYYRQIIEHPEWMSEEAIQSGQLYNGSDRGRIYRISKTDAQPAAWMNGLKLGDAADGALVEELSNPNGWWRLNAQRLLIDRGGKEAVPALKQQVQNQSSSLARLHALWTLEGLGALTPDLIEMSLQDRDAGIRENAIRLAESFLKTSPSLFQALLALQNDEDSKVRFQLLCTLGFLDSPASAETRRNLLFRDLDDQWVQIAALSANRSQTYPLLKEVLGHYQPDRTAYASLAQRLTSMIGTGGDLTRIRSLIHQALGDGDKNYRGWEAPVAEGLARGMERKSFKGSDFKNELPALIKACFEAPSEPLRNAALHLLSVIKIEDKSELKKGVEQAVGISRDNTLPDGQRAEAIRFLALDELEPHASLLKSLINPRERQAVQRAALKNLGLIPGHAFTNLVLQEWATLTPELRTEAVAAFMGKPERINHLLNAIDSGRIQKSSIVFYQRVQLMTQPDEKIRTRARALFAENQEDQVTRAYRPALQIKGDASKGKAVYVQNCVICHQVRGALGVSFGPDLGTIHSWPPEGIMANILSPNLSIAAGFDLWEVELDQGEMVQGLITSETPGAITLKNAEGKQTTINRQDIISLKTLNISAMPAGWEKTINHQQMADLLAFLRQLN
ncbi:MAG TPA: c-type cytochrome [Saprospiraceae bacterium]|nr:c-type cytochrome [Saprospiraceae bacterium]